MDYPGGAYQSSLLRGIAEGAARHGANLLCFGHGSLATRPDARNARDRFSELMGSHNVDGAILLSSTLMHAGGMAGLVRLCRLVADIPRCSVGVELEGSASVLADNQTGVREAIAHLIRDHRAKHIAFIAGPEANAEADERVDAYRSELERHGVAFEPDLIVPGDFSPEAGRAAVRTLAKMHGRRLETLNAIVACNDHMAIAALDELERLNVRVPETLAVVGFDDIEDARLTQPALATVRQPLTKMGAQALASVLEPGTRQGPPARLKLGTELVKRPSCGCGGPSTAPRSSIPPAVGSTFDATMLMRRERIANRLARAASGRFGPAGPDWEGKLLNALHSDLRAERTAGRTAEFGAALHAVAERLLSGGVDLNLLDHVVSVLRREIVPLVRGNASLRDCAEESFHVSRLTTSGLIQRSLNRERIKLSTWTQTTAFVCNALATAFDYAELRTRLQNELPRLGIRTCFVAVYEPASEPPRARLLLAYDTGGKCAPAQGATFHPRTLIPAELVHTNEEGRSFVVLPLSWGTELLGHIMLDFDLTQVFAHEAIAEAVGGALYGARLAGSPLETSSA
jgi:DNA-binding LacI/PurR family transcriptional regulator